MPMHYFDYDKIVDPKTGEWLGKKPYFILFIYSDQYTSNVNRDSMMHLAKHFNGEIQFAVITIHMEERLSHAYETYDVARAFYIEDGMAYAFEKGLTGFEITKKWIE